MKEKILDQLDLYIWAKDKNYRYIYCNENYAMAAGLDSPEKIIGKSDDQLPWRKFADYFRTQTPEEVVYEVVIGSNLRPSAIFLQRVIDLHREVKRDLYILIRKKIAEQYFTVA